MEQTLKFSGINRLYSDYAGNGSCEELINLRVTGGGVETVKSKKALMTSVPYTDIFQHNLGFRTNIIAKVKATQGYNYQWVDENGRTLAVLYTVRNGSDEVYFATLGNMIIFSNKTRRENEVFRFVDSAYVSVDGNVPDLPIAINVGAEKTMTIEARSLPTADMGQAAFLESLRAALTETEETNPSICFGDTLLAFNFRTKDGEEFWTFRWAYVPIASKGAGEQKIETRALCSWNTTATHEEGGPNASVSTTAMKMKVTGRPISVTLGPTSVGETSMLSAVNIYATRPKTVLDANDLSVAEFSAPMEILWNKKVSGTRPNLADQTTLTVDFLWKEGFTGASLEDCEGSGSRELSGAYVLDTADTKRIMEDGGLLYLQESIPMDDLETSMTVELSFGGATQMNGKTMIVDAGAVTRYGHMLSYNNRLHFYGDTVRTRLHESIPAIVTSPGTECDTYYVYTRNGVDTPVYGGKTAYGASPVIIAPSAAITKVYISLGGTIYSHRMTPSKNYNFSYGFYKDGEYIGAAKGQELASITATSYETEETQDVNATEISNPFVFAVEHSYRIPGVISSLLPAYREITDVQVGQYPLNAFTDRGVFAMEQGNGNVLYSNIVPVSPLRSIGETRISPSGTFFVANRGLYLLQGRTAILVSELLSNGPHKEIRACREFGLLTDNNRTYHITDHLSQVTFEEFIEGASLAFDPLRNELIVSNMTYKYSYVFNLNTKLWHKITASYASSSDNKYILERSFSGNTTATSASGTLKVDALFTETTHPFPSTGSATLSLPSVFPAGEEVSLYIDGREAASCRLSFTAPAKIVMAALTESLSYLDFTSTSPSDTKVYSNDPALNGKQMEVRCGTSSYITTLSPSTETATISKSDGNTLSLTIGGKTVSVSVTTSDTEATLATKLASKLGASGTGFTASASGNTVSLTTLSTGSVNNNLLFSFNPNQSSTLFASVSFTGFSGGRDSQSTTSVNVNVLDSEHEEEGQRTIHLQTRPHELGKGHFTHLMRSVLQSRAFLDGDENLSLSVFATDNLKDYQCISTLTKKNANISQIRLPRAARSQRYYVFVSGGIVDTLTQINDLIMEVEAVTNRIG